MNGITLSLAPLLLFAVAASITPGPNNLLVMRSGARFGIGPTVKHIFGIEIGFAGIIVLSQLGVGALFTWPPAARLLQWLCVAYLLWLAWGTARDDGAHGAAPAGARPMTLVEAMAFQLVNPKAWMMAITGVTAFRTVEDLTAIDRVLIVTVFIGVGFPCVFVWALWGTAIHHVLRKPAARRAFNLAMAALIVVSAVMMLQGSPALVAHPAL